MRRVEGDTMRAVVRSRWEAQSTRFLVVGAANTVFGYGVFVALALLLDASERYLLVLALTYAVSGQVSFLSHRLLTYRVHGWPFLALDYGRYWSVNAGTVLLNAAVLPLLVELARVPPVPAQALALLIVTVASYVGHTYFSFRRPSSCS